MSLFWWVVGILFFVYLVYSLFKGREVLRAALFYGFKKGGGRVDKAPRVIRNVFRPKN